MDELSQTITFRHQVSSSDRNRISEIALSSGFFRKDEVDVVIELLDEVVDKGKASSYNFILALAEGKLTGFACYGAIPCTIGSFDLYWIAVDQAYRNKGIGKTLLLEVEKSVRKLNGRQLFIETSSTPKYKPSQEFYLNSGYCQVGRLPDFYLPGDDKLIYVKKIL